MVEFGNDSILPIKFTMDEDDAPQIYLNPVIEKIALEYNYTILQTLKAIQTGYHYYAKELMPYERGQGMETISWYDWVGDVLEKFGFEIIPKGRAGVFNHVFDVIQRNVISSKGIKTPLNLAIKKSLGISDWNCKLKEVRGEFGKNLIQLDIEGWDFSPGLFNFKLKRPDIVYFLNWLDNPFES